MRAILKTIHFFATIMAACISLGVANNAFATLIDFDDLTPVYDPEFPCWCANPLTDQYASQGVIFNGGAWVNGDANANNVMIIGSGGTSITFIGELPTFVSMNVTSLQGDVIGLEAWGTSGLIEYKQTLGWFGSEEGYIPAVPNELISFSADDGISSIFLLGFYNFRAEAAIDNIHFTYASIPEPSSLMLISLGLLSIAWRKAKH